MGYNFIKETPLPLEGKMILAAMDGRGAHAQYKNLL